VTETKTSRRRRQCGGKHRWQSETIARNYATALGWKGLGVLRPYLCKHCQYWHVGHERRKARQ
jgi:hypothetical protein